eukprot:TRINITY_DN27033_c0_g1_i1.p1 TRINITY_DN27033_c0_g1~~TRINITY_DN27033_c0_g1_i1.p1  ORF type:complete len:195 (-),score=47.94 TRINITY_DN27033_c0_g1_i1:302-886(-)
MAQSNPSSAAALELEVSGAPIAGDLSTIVQCSDKCLVSSADVLSSKVVGLLFTASWCPPCRDFVRIMGDAYYKIRSKHGEKSFQIIHVPMDREEERYDAHASQMPWVGVPLKNREAIVRLFLRFAINQIPRLVLVDSKQELLCENARGGRGFGFGCDALAAYAVFAAMADERAVKPKRTGGQSAKRKAKSSNGR